MGDTHEQQRAAALRRQPTVREHTPHVPGGVYRTYYGSCGWTVSLFCLDFETEEDAANSLTAFRAHMAKFVPQKKRRP